jgi:endonuclease III
MTGRPERIVAELLDRHGRLYCEQAGVRLADRPAPLYQLLVLSTLLNARIPADVAVTAARALFAAGYRSAKAMSEAGWAERVDALDRGGYLRYDERTATVLGDSADLLAHRWHGDLRRLRDQAGGDPGMTEALLAGLPGLGSAGAGIFLREVQAVWPAVAPYVDTPMTSGARRVGLPDSRSSLASLLAGSGQPARLAAALVRVSLSPRAASEITAAVPD